MRQGRIGTEVPPEEPPEEPPKEEESTYSKAVTADSPALYWRLGESFETTAVDFSGNGRSGTYANGPTLYQPGILPNGDPSKSVLFDGVDSEVVRNDEAVLDLAGDFTIEAWVKSTAPLGTGQTIMSKYDAESWVLTMTSGSPSRFEFYIHDSSETYREIVAGTWLPNTTYHVVGRRSGTTLSLWINGAQVGETPAPLSPLNGGGPFKVGRINRGGGEPFKGYIDEVAIYSTALSKARIEAHYAAGGGAVPTGIYWGADMDGDVAIMEGESARGDGGYEGASSDVTWNRFEEHAGRKVDIVHIADPWLTWEGYAPSRAHIHSRGAIPMITIPIDTAAMFEEMREGKKDALITTWAEKAAAWGYPIFIRPWWEANGNWYVWSRASVSDANYKAGWKRFYEKVTAKASNVSFVYCVNVIYDSASEAAISGRYPGDAYVDWVAMDGYAGHPPGGNDFGNRTPAETFTPTYNKLQSIAPTKPIMIAETACSEINATKSTWLTELLTDTLPNKLPKVRALVYFNWNVAEGEGGQRADWPIESSTAAKNAFKAGIAGAYYLEPPAAAFTKGTKVPVP